MSEFTKQYVIGILSSITVNALGTDITLLLMLEVSPSLLMAGLVFVVCGAVWHAVAVQVEQNTKQSSLSSATF